MAVKNLNCGNRSGTRKYGKGAAEMVERAMRRRKRGILRSGKAVW